jgi:hypothetical protein
LLTFTETVVEWEREPLVPVTVIVNVSMVLPEHVKAAIPEPVTLVGLKLHVKPDEDALDVRAITPLNPLTLANATSEVPESPAAKLMVEGLVLIVKSTTWKRMLAVVWESVPLVPVTVTV